MGFQPPSFFTLDHPPEAWLPSHGSWSKASVTASHRSPDALLSRSIGVWPARGPLPASPRPHPLCTLIIIPAMVTYVVTACLGALLQGKCRWEGPRSLATWGNQEGTRRERVWRRGGRKRNDHFDFVNSCQPQMRPRWALEVLQNSSVPPPHLWNPACASSGRALTSKGCHPTSFVSVPHVPWPEPLCSSFA